MPFDLKQYDLKAMHGRVVRADVVSPYPPASTRAGRRTAAATSAARPGGPADGAGRGPSPGDHMRGRARREVNETAAGCGDKAALGDVLEFMRMIWGISHGLQSTSKRMEAELGVTGPQRLVVRILGRCPGASAGQLAGILHLHPSTLTGVLRRLEERGALERRPGERDRRQARLRLTPAGRAVDRRHAGTVEDAVRSVLSELEPGKVATTVEVLRALERELNGAPSRRPRAPRRRTRAA